MFNQRMLQLFKIMVEFQLSEISMFGFQPCTAAGLLRLRLICPANLLLKLEYEEEEEPTTNKPCKQWLMLLRQQQFY